MRLPWVIPYLGLPPILFGTILLVEHRGTSTLELLIDVSPLGKATPMASAACSGDGTRSAGLQSFRLLGAVRPSAYGRHERDRAGNGSYSTISTRPCCSLLFQPDGDELAGAATDDHLGPGASAVRHPADLVGALSEAASVFDAALLHEVLAALEPSSGPLCREPNSGACVADGRRGSLCRLCRGWSGPCGRTTSIVPRRCPSPLPSCGRAGRRDGHGSNASSERSCGAWSSPGVLRL